jgi:hypothetical protein
MNKFSTDQIKMYIEALDKDLSNAALEKVGSVELITKHMNEFLNAVDDVCALAEKTLISDFIKAALIVKAEELHSKYKMIDDFGNNHIMSISLPDNIKRLKDGSLCYAE